MKTFFRSLALAAVVLPQMASACFDTYMFLEKRSLVYPEGQYVVEGSGEYVMPSMKNAGTDILSGNANVYYGFSKRFSMQVGVGSSEKERSSFSVDQYGVRGVFGVIQGYRNVYNMDVILEHSSPFSMEENSFELSAPNLFHVHNYTFVIHPVTSFGRNVSFNVRGHGGVFYRFHDVGVIGIGGEYASAQSGTQFGQRLVKGESATSLFVGSKIGSLFLQNEFIKGWGKDGNDFGFAATVKFALPKAAH
ncbi:MAG: hypothetical protein MUF22_00740 [Chitinispirillaceae bacterium]|jgi:hypothetical protein|nr:hypothetical protein [Chitinispirillaceae bacterium]